MRHVYAQGAKARGLTFALARVDFEELVFMLCHYCGAGPSNFMRKSRNGTVYEFSYNGLDRVDPSLGYSRDNVVTCCGTCNKLKSDLTYEAFVGQITRILAHLSERSTCPPQ